MSHWHTLTPSAIAQELQTDLSHGLSSDEARKRLTTYGANALPEKKKETLLHIFVSQFQSPLIFVLAGASVALFYLQEINDSLIIAFILFFNAGIGTLQEGRAQNTIEALKRFITTQATVLRGQREVIIPDTEIVPGDILILKEGEKIPADARIIECYGLRVDEAAITGESGAVNKSPAILKKLETAVADRKNMLLKGSAIVGGNALAVCVATGAETEIGKVSAAIATMDTDIPLKKDIKTLSHLIIKIVGITCGLLFLLGIAMGNTVQVMFATAVSLAVSLIPEGLPVVLTLVLANGVWRMAKRNALIKKMQAVEALGQAHVIAVDKTGTITKNELTVTDIYAGNAIFTVTGVGYNPQGSVMLNQKLITFSDYTPLMLLNKIALLSSNAHVALQEETKEWHISGDPTEAAMVVLSQKMGISKEELDEQYPRLSELPFDYKTRYHATLHKDRNGAFLALAGAPETILSLSKTTISEEDRAIAFTAERKKILEEQIQSFSKKGKRVICFAYKKITFAAAHSFNASHVSDLCFAGLYAMEDCLRPEIKEAVKKAKAAGLHIVMMTGDHALTAAAIAQEAGIYTDGDHILTGEELSLMSPQELDRHLPSTSVFARVTPEHKMILIQGYRRIGKIIAMTGDGINDAPALVSADLGIAMGKGGTEVAKEAADIILLDDNFASIVAAIEEGRRIFYAMRRVIFYLFSTSLGEALMIAATLLAGLPLPLLPAQIIWLNLVTDTFLDVSLGLERRRGSHILRSMVEKKRQLIDRQQFFRMILIAVCMTIGTLIVFTAWYQIDMTKALTLSLTTLAAFQWFNAWNARSETTSLFRINPFSNIYLLGALTIVISLQVFALSNPFLQQVLHVTPLSLNEWLTCIGVASSVLLVEEVRKFFARHSLAKSSAYQRLALETQAGTLPQ